MPFLLRNIYDENLDNILINKDTSMNKRVLDALFENLIFSSMKTIRVQLFLPNLSM